MERNKKGLTFALAAIMMMVAGSLAVPGAVTAESVDLDEQIEVDLGATDLLGGGDQFFVKFGSDAAFGIVWGTDGAENCIYFVTIKARYLGVVQVFNSEGEILESNRTVKVYTMYAVKLDSMLEFDDINDDGLLNYTREYDVDEFTGYEYEEPIYKKVDLRTAWNASDIIETDGEDSKSWEFSLTADNLPYELVDENATADVGDNVLNNLTLTFHLTADLAQMDNASLPQWRVTVTKGPVGSFMMAEKLEDIQISGRIFKYDVKWDQEIEGWDFDPNSTNPAVLIEFHSIVGNFISKELAAWMYTFSYMNALTVMNCESMEGELEVNETTGDYVIPRQLISTRLTFGSDWSEIGVLTWVDEVTVDGEPEYVKAQIMGGHKVAAMTAPIDGTPRVFTGFVAIGAMVFPGGNRIVHDPTYSSEALVDVSIDEKPRLPVFLLLAAAAVIVVLGVAIAATMSSGRKPGKGARDSYEMGKSSQPGDWSKYYNKK